MNLPFVCIAVLTACIEAALFSGLSVSSVFADELGDAVRQAVRQVDPSIVRLRPIGAQQATDGGVMASAPTTGVVISDQGEILTSAFALQGDPQAVVVETFDGQRHTAQVIATDFVRKLVLLRVAEGTWKAPSVPPRDSIRVGQWVVAVGRFYATDVSNVSVGIVSARDRIHGMALQTDAKISPMNYGGPLIDLLGNVHGILVPMSPTVNSSAGAGVEWYDSGIGFAVPLEDAMLVAERLRSGKDQPGGLMGVSFSSSNRFSPEVIVSQVRRSGPGDLAGLRTGDKLVSVNGQVVTRSAVIEAIAARSYAGESLALEVLRDGAKLALTVELTDQLPVVEPGFLGILPLARTPAEDASGVDVVVLDSGAAHAAGLSGRVKLLSIDDTQTNTLSQLHHAASQLSPGQKVVLKYQQPDQPDELSVTLTTIERPHRPDAVSAANVRLYISDADPSVEPNAAEAVDAEIERQEVDLGASGRCVVFHPGTSDKKRRAGMVVLLSAVGKPEESILRRWKQFIVSHDLTLVIPMNPENGRLTVEDVPLIGESAIRVVTERQIDRSRLVLVADQRDVNVARRLFMDSRSPFRGVVMETGWMLPETSAGETAGSRRGILLLEVSADRQTEALQQQAAIELNDAGYTVYRGAAPEESEDREQQSTRQIADWTMLIKSL